MQRFFSFSFLPFIALSGSLWAPSDHTALASCSVLPKERVTFALFNSAAGGKGTEKVTAASAHLRLVVVAKAVDANQDAVARVSRVLLCAARHGKRDERRKDRSEPHGAQQKTTNTAGAQPYPPILPQSLQFSFSKAQVVVFVNTG